MEADNAHWEITRGGELEFVASPSRLLGALLLAFLTCKYSHDNFPPHTLAPNNNLFFFLSFAQRNLNFVENWEKETLRSSTETVVWIAVIHNSFTLTQRYDFAFIMGTLSACLVVFIGEYMSASSRVVQKTLRKFFGESEKDAKSLASTSSVMVILYGYGALSAMISNVKDIFGAVLLASLAGASLLFSAQIIGAIPFSRRCGAIIQDRIYKASTNWVNYPMRSAAELSIFLGVTAGTYAMYHDFPLAIRASVLCGCLVSLGEDLVGLGEKTFGKFSVIGGRENKRTNLVPTAVIVYAIVFTCHWIFTDVPTLFGRPISFPTQLFLSVCGALFYFVLGRIFMSIDITAKCGEVIQERLLATGKNWENYPIRSTVEVGTTNAVVWGVWYATGSLCPTLGASFICGPLMILFHESFPQWSYDTTKVAREETAAKIAASKASESISSSQREAVVSTPWIRPRDRPKKEFTMEEIRKHDKPNDIYLLIHNQVYDVTQFAKEHPGGSIVYKFGGKDASDQFAAFHRPKVSGYLKAFHIGSLKKEEVLSQNVDEATKDYRTLRDRLWKEGYFKANQSFYNKKHAVWVSLILLSILTISVSDSFYVRTILGGCFLGIGWQQAAFMAHDAEHHGILEPPKKGCINWLGWFLGCVIFGISADMWNEEHSMHHAITIRPREDPQFNYLPIWLIDEKELSNEKVDGKGGYKMNRFIKFLVRLQHFHFLPLILIVGRINLHAISFVHDLKLIFIEGKYRNGLVGIVGMCLYWSWHCSLLSLLDSWKEVVVFSIASHLSSGILHVQLLLSHMNTDTMDEEEEEEAGFFRFQLAVSRNIDVHWTENWFHGGLEYQIEHHLFPQLPRHNLSAVKPFVEEICKKHGILYRDDTFTEALGGILGNLRELAWAIVTLDQ